jgi:hypothetical protein
MARSGCGSFVLACLVYYAPRQRFAALKTLESNWCCMSAKAHLKSVKVLVSGSVILLILCITCWAQAPETPSRVNSSTQVHWSGTVSDVRGRGVEGAEVFVFASYLGERHATDYLISAVSNAEGRWRAELELTPTEFQTQLCQNVYVFWQKAGHCCDFFHVPCLFHDESKNKNKLSPGNLKLIVPAGKASLSVKAVRGDAPRAGAVVRIANEHWPKLYPANRKPEGEAGVGTRLDEILHPVARTDEHGVARFEDLAAGTYRILVAERDSEGLYVAQVDPEGEINSASYRGVSLRPGEDRRFNAAVYEQTNCAALQVLQADGEPASWETTVFEYCHGTSLEGATGSGGWIDERGRADFSFGKPGLWRMYVRERELGGVMTRVEPPCYEAAGVVAVSPLLENAPPTVLTSRWVERDEVARRSRKMVRRDAKFSEVDGRVFYADGKTPACGARILALEAKTADEVYRTRSDASGRFSAKCYPQPAGDSTESVIVALLPGVCGATVVPLSSTERERDWSIELPQAMSLRGRVTIDGKSTSQWNNQIRVLAAYEVQDKLAELLSIRVSPDKDGSFELAGLTPGRYRIQASMDDIWLSSSVSLVVKPDGVESEPLALDIGRPGVRSVIRCVDRAGKPVAGIQVELQRPTGPLAKVLWPVTFTADGAGILNLPPLEAGRHTLRVPSLQNAADPAKRSEHTITIKELTPDLRPLELDLVVD